MYREKEKGIPPRLGVIRIYHRTGMGLQQLLGPVMVSASMHGIVIKCFRYYYRQLQHNGRSTRSQLDAGNYLFHLLSLLHLNYFMIDNPRDLN